MLKTVLFKQKANDSNYQLKRNNVVSKLTLLRDDKHYNNNNVIIILELIWHSKFHKSDIF
jgi:hypothetical protein